MRFPADLNSMPRQILSLTFDKVKDTRDWSLVTTGICTWQKIPCTSHFLAGHPPTLPTSPRTQNNWRCHSHARETVCVFLCHNVSVTSIVADWRNSRNDRKELNGASSNLLQRTENFVDCHWSLKRCALEITWKPFPGRRPREQINLAHTVSQPGAVSFNFIHNAYPPTQCCVPYADNWGTCVNCKQNYICPFLLSITSEHNGNFFLNSLSLYIYIYNSKASSSPFIVTH